MERNLRPTLIVVGGTILVAFIGWYGNHLTSRFENARMITQLQIQREEAESSLRGAIFNETISTFLGDTDTPSDISRRLLRLELLALNFGDTVSLSPLFKDMRRTIANVKPASSTISEQLGAHRARLTSLARQVASRQFSSVTVHGVERHWSIPLDERGRLFANGRSQHVWPRDTVEEKLAEIVEMVFESDAKAEIAEQGLLSWLEAKEERWLNSPEAAQRDTDSIWPAELGLGEDEVTASERSRMEHPPLTDEEQDLLVDLRRLIAQAGCLYIKGLKHEGSHRVEVIVSSPRVRTMTVKVQLKLWQVADCDSVRQPGEVEPEPDFEPDFDLDFFNFPKIDNTRLKSNQRFAIIMESFKEATGSTQPGKVSLAAVIFPSEYASLADKPGMKEAVKLMKDAMDAESD